MLKISINQVPDYIKLAAKSKNNILIVGNPGVGKSQVIEGMRSDKCKVTTMTGSSTIEEYVNGIPQVNKDTNVLEYISQKWFVEMEEFADENPDALQILFLDEFNTADAQVLKTFLTILAERRIPTLNKSIPDNVVIVAAMNPNDQNDTERLIRPMASRFMVLNAVSTMDTYRDFLEGKEKKSVIHSTISEVEVELTLEEKMGLLEQIGEDEWNDYNDQNEEKSYHEINPRSFSNFLRALGYIKPDDRKAVTTMLARAFLGKNIRWPEDLKEVMERRKRRIKNGSAYPTENELREMDTEALREYERELSKPSVTGTAARTCRLTIKRILRERGE